MAVSFPVCLGAEKYLTEGISHGDVDTPSHVPRDTLPSATKKIKGVGERAHVLCTEACSEAGMNIFADGEERKC